MFPILYVSLSSASRSEEMNGTKVQAVIGRSSEMIVPDAIKFC